MATLIAWTDETWNPTTGCSRVSDGCRNCYAERLSLKFGWSKYPWTANHAKDNVILRPERLRKPYGFKKASRVFVNSMSDLFHEQIPDEYIARVFAVMADLPQHTFQVLTKRPERAARWGGPWTDNIWMGTSVEDGRVAHRIDTLRNCAAKVKFLSCEPLIGPLGVVDLTSIDWVIVGGESGPGYRPMPHEWARDIRDLCLTYGAAFFFKQSAAFTTERGTALIDEDGSAWQWYQYPGHHAAPVEVTPPTRVKIPA